MGGWVAGFWKTVIHLPMVVLVVLQKAAAVPLTRLVLPLTYACFQYSQSPTFTKPYEVFTSVTALSFFYMQNIQSKYAIQQCFDQANLCAATTDLCLRCVGCSSHCYFCGVASVTPGDIKGQR